MSISLFNRIKRIHSARLGMFMLSTVILILSVSCVHEFPEVETPQHDIVLTIRHNQEWTQKEMIFTRQETHLPLCRYHIKVYLAGTDIVPVAEYIFFNDDIERNDYTVTLKLNEGDYDLYCWSDYADGSSKSSYFFDSTEFHSIVYSEPYNGNNELRDAFRGNVSFTVENIMNSDNHQNVELMLERPFARYEFRATDLNEFVDQEITRGKLSRSDQLSDSSPANIEQHYPSISNYRVKMIYSGYMPSRFDNFLNRPVDSLTGISYDAKIDFLSGDETRLGFDHVMVNGHESSIAVTMEVYDDSGQIIGRTPVINVPTKRGRNTIVRGRFLTSKTSGGIGIDPGYKGEYNIQL